MPQVLKHSLGYQHLHFYQKSDTIYQLTYIFCQRFLPKYGDRTVDQMLQAARSGKQNIVEGIEAGRTSSETELTKTTCRFHQNKPSFLLEVLIIK